MMEVYTMDSIKGSEIAKKGFENEKYVVNKFNNWKTDEDARKWLKIMGYDFNKINELRAMVLNGYKTDVQVILKYNNIIKTENLQVKLVSNSKGFNQIDKRWIDNYKKMWNIPEDIVKLLKYFTGENKPYKESKKENRMFINEFNIEEQHKILNFFSENKTLILNDIFKGRGEFAAKWILVIQKTDTTQWIMKPMDIVLNLYGKEDVKISPRGSIKIGKVTMQRKGGDKGRETANMLQFKINPLELFTL